MLTRERMIEAIQTCAFAAVVVWGIVAPASEGAASNPEPSQGGADAAQSPGEPLQPLAWLLGEWTGMTDNAVVLVSAHWCEGGAFIERQFVVKRAGQEDVGGTQRIGWDPVGGRIKCWTFDSLGGTGEGYWRHDGDTWIVESNEVLADGGHSSTKTVLTPQGTGRFHWEVESASVDGVDLPKQRIEFVRAEQD